MYSYNELQEFSLSGCQLNGNILKRQRNKPNPAFNFPTHTLQNFTLAGKEPSLQASSSSETLGIISKESRSSHFPLLYLPSRTDLLHGEQIF